MDQAGTHTHLYCTRVDALQPDRLRCRLSRFQVVLSLGFEVVREAGRGCVVPVAGSSMPEGEADSSTPAAAVDTRNVPAVTGSNTLRAQEDSIPQVAAQRKPLEQVADRRSSAPEVDSSTPFWVEGI